MKKIVKIIASTSFLASVLFLASCSNTPKGDSAVVADEALVDSATGIELTIDTAYSRIGFIGNGVGKNHPGFFGITSGKIVVSGGKIKGGEFTINTKSLVLNEQEEMFQTKLKGHLLGPDFLDSEKFPTAKFEITSVEPYIHDGKDSSVVAGANYTVSGNLTLKDVTKNVSFPANIALVNNTFSAKANFNIDRTVWGLKYGNDKSLKDKFISEVVNITFDIKGN